MGLVWTIKIWHFLLGSASLGVSRLVWHVHRLRRRTEGMQTVSLPFPDLRPQATYEKYLNVCSRIRSWLSGGCFLIQQTCFKFYRVKCFQNGQLVNSLAHAIKLALLGPPAASVLAIKMVCWCTCVDENVGRYVACCHLFWLIFVNLSSSCFRCARRKTA